MIPESSDNSIDTCKQKIMPNIKFSSIVKKWLNVLLNNIRFRLFRFIFTQESDDFISLHNFDSIASIGILSRLHNPYFIRIFWFVCESFECISIIYLKTVCFWKNSKWIFL